MSYDLKNIQVIGYTTDFCQCECCGKENLRGTVSILDIESGVVLHFGTTCAAKADKYDSLEAAAKAKKEIAKELRVVEDWKRYAWVMRRKLNIAEEKVDDLADAFVTHMLNKETRLLRFNWESWK